MDNKKISQIYRERLQNVETSPPEEVWENISAALDTKERKRRFLPLWYKIGGIAAGLVLICGLFYQTSLTSTPSDSVSFSEPADIKTYNFDPFSKYYEETMLRSVILLETLMASPGNIPAKNAAPEEIQMQERIEEGIAEAMTTKSVVPNNAVLSSTSSALNDQDSKSEEQSIIPEELTETDEAEEMLAANESVEDLKKEKSLSKRFSVSTTAGAVYFDNMGKGNALDPQFAKDSRGEISMAYGVNLAYRISEKVKIRTGVSKVELNQNTPDMTYASAVNSEDISFNNETLASPGTGELHQSMGFIEIPLEIEYNLIDRKIGLSLIGGASTLVLDENMVSINSPYSSTRLGEAKNLNNVSFSSNIGLGLNYNISEEFQVHLEPIFKYQLNTFDSSTGANPYYFGIYSGLSYKF